jgi:hypothetical protein
MVWAIQTIAVTALHVTPLQYSLLFEYFLVELIPFFRKVIVTGIEYKIL